MTVYNINRGIGWASSGVEYAQMYRAALFRAEGIPARFIFTDFFPGENIAHFTENLDFRDEEVIWLYSFFTDQPVGPSLYPITRLEQSFADQSFEKEQVGDHLTYRFDDGRCYVNAFLSRADGSCLQRTEYVAEGKLLRRDYYFTEKIFSEYYAPEDGTAKPYLRRFFHRDGREAYTEVLDGEESFYSFPDRRITGKAHLIAYMMEKLAPGAGDVILIDRATEIARAVLEHRGQARVGTIVHAEHYNESATDELNILWNNYYEYEFSQCGEIDFFVASTKAQSQTLEEQMRRYYGRKVRVETIPVGALPALQHPVEPRRRHGMVTASRLAEEKHIDYLIEAATRARETVPDLSLDIYGRGGLDGYLQDCIRQAGAEKYIRLMGHQDMERVYVNYEAYVSASGSEGFGLSLLEAAGSGLAMIGFDVPYGNPTFIEDGCNGILLDCTHRDRKQAVAALAQAMVRLFTRMDLQGCASASYRIAEPYLREHVGQAWRRLIEKQIAGAEDDGIENTAG